jgi:hypothetical protein
MSVEFVPLLHKFEILVIFIAVLATISKEIASKPLLLLKVGIVVSVSWDNPVFTIKKEHIISNNFLIFIILRFVIF